MRFFIALVLLFTTLTAGAQTKPKETCCHVELYLLNGTYTFRQDNFSPIGYFMPKDSYLAPTPFVLDSEITTYELPKDSSQPYFIHLSPNAAKRVNALAAKAPLFDGVPFAVVVDGRPIYGAYLWNVNSSFGCDWILAMSWPDRIGIYPGLPHFCFSAAHPDPRGDAFLIDRFRRTGRIMLH